MYDRVTRLQAMLFNEWRYLSNDGRDLPIEWNIMHMYSSAQIAKLLAMKRQVDTELASLTATLHDIAAVTTGKCDRHGETAEPYIREAVSRYNQTADPGLFIEKNEEDSMIEAIKVHSNKREFSDNKLAELLKDVDSLDRWLNAIETQGVYSERRLKALMDLGIENSK